MQKVKQWLDGKRNFIIGRAIYKALGTDQALISLLEQGCNVYTVQQLELGMEALISGPALVIIDEQVDPPGSAAARKKNTSAPSAYMAAGGDAVLQAIQREWELPYKKMQYLRAQLDKYGPSNEPEAIAYREPLAAEILELEQLCMELWEKRDHYQQYGQLPADHKQVVEVPTDPMQLATLINRIKRNIRTNRQQMQLHPDKAGFATKYLAYKIQFQQITGKTYQEVNNE